MKWYDRRWNHPVYRKIYMVWFSMWNLNEYHAPVQWYARHTRKLGWNTRGAANLFPLVFLISIPLIAILIVVVRQTWRWLW